MVVRVDMKSDGKHFTVRCDQTPQNERSAAGSCAVVGPAASREQWHTGHGTVHPVNHSATLVFDDGQWLEGAVGNGTIVWKRLPTTARQRSSCGHGRTRQRFKLRSPSRRVVVLSS